MAAKEVLANIKNTLEDCVGHRIRLKANRGRKKVYEKTGILEQTYPHIFVIKLDEHHSVVRRVSFSYTDVLTETVELTVYRGGQEQRIEAVKA
ncbi:MAG: Veg protein [Clostridia bacterium]|nr:Veg protein [Clostridia bacterium]